MVEEAKAEPGVVDRALGCRRRAGRHRFGSSSEEVVSRPVAQVLVMARKENGPCAWGTGAVLAWGERLGSVRMNSWTIPCRGSMPGDGRYRFSISLAPFLRTAAPVVPRRAFDADQQEKNERPPDPSPDGLRLLRNRMERVPPYSRRISRSRSSASSWALSRLMRTFIGGKAKESPSGQAWRWRRDWWHRVRQAMR